MRLFEVLLLVDLLFSAGGILAFKKAKYKMILPFFSILLSFISIITEGFRSAMLPAYMLSFLLLVFSLLRAYSKHSGKHRMMRTFGIVGFCLVYVIAFALPAFLPVINLPKPSGSNSVGTMRYDFIEPNRKNIMTLKSSSQKIAVQIWYPASSTNNRKRAVWMDNRRAAGFFAKEEKLPDLFGQLCLIKTNSYWNAPLSNYTEKYPVILFSGGSGMINSQNTIQMEELASNGYIVFAVSHPHDDFAAVYRDGSIVAASKNQLFALSEDNKNALSIAERQVSNKNSSDYQRVTIKNSKLSTENVRVWSTDMCFVADEVYRLSNGSISSIFKGRINTGEIGILGHSFGGAAAGEACLRDSRFKAFVNLDGTPFGDTVDHVVKQPFMIMTKNAYNSFSPNEGYAKKQKNYLIVSIRGAKHLNFTDLNTIIPYAGKTLGALGTINPNRQTKIINTYIVAFFNKYLKGTNEPVLETSSSQFTEVTIQYR